MPPRPRKRPTWDPTEHIGRFLLVDDDRAYAELRAPFFRELRPVDTACSLREAEARLAGPFPYVAAVVDVVLPDGNGLDWLVALRRRGVDLPVLLLTGITELSHLVHLRADTLHARILHKDDERRAPGEFHALLARCRDAGIEYEMRTLGPRAALFDLSEGQLTQAELRVLELRLAGHSNGEAAEELGVSTSTVKNHVTRALAKCGAEGRRIDWLRERVDRRAHARSSRARS